MRYFQLCLIFILILTGCKKDEIKKIEGTLAWKTKVSNWMRYGKGLGWVDASPAIGSDGTIYAEGSFLEDTIPWNFYLYALKPDGTIKWLAYTFNNYAVSSITIGQDGTIYAGCVNGLMAFYPNGAVKWKNEDDIELDYYLPALGSDGTLYIFRSFYELYAVNTDGTKKWKIILDYWNDSIFVWAASHLVIGSDGTIYFVAEGYIEERGGTFLFALNPDGSIKWIYLLNESGEVEYLPIALGSEGVIYVADFEGNVFAVNPDGKLKWKKEDITEGATFLVIGKDAIYLTDGYYLYALSLNGNLLWKREVPDPVELTALALSSDGTIYVSSLEWDAAGGYPYKYYGYLYAFSQKGELKWKFKPDGGICSAPTIGQDGTVYFNCTDGYLYAINGSGKLANSPWPKIQRDLKNNGRVE